MMLEQNAAKGWRGILRGNVLMLGLISFFTDLSSEMIYPLLPIFMTGLLPLGEAAVYIGIMEGTAESIANLLKVFSGHISDRIKKRKRFAIIGYGISTLFRPCMALATAGWMVVAFRSFDRVGKGLRTAPRDALISDSVDQSLWGRAFSFHRVMDHAGAVLGPVMAAAALSIFWGQGVWSERGGAATPDEMRALRWIFAAALLPGLAAMAFLIGKVRDIEPAAKAKATHEEVPLSPKTVALPKRFYYYLGIVTLFALGNSSDLFLVLYGKTKFDLPLSAVIVLWAMLHISKIVFSLPGGILSDKFGRRIMILIGWLVYVGVYSGMVFVTPDQPMVFWGLIAAYGAYYGLTEGAERALVADYIAPKDRGKAFGFYHGAIGMASLPASLLFGIFWSSFRPELAFTIGAALAAAATVLLMLFLGISGGEKHNETHVRGQ